MGYDKLTNDLKNRLKEQKKQRQMSKEVSDFQAELDAEQNKRAQQGEALHKKNKEKHSSEAMRGYGSWEVAVLSCFERMMSLHEEWRKSPHYDTTVWFLKNLHKGWVFATATYDEFDREHIEHMSGEKIGLEYNIQIDDKGKPSI